MSSNVKQEKFGNAGTALPHIDTLNIGIVAAEWNSQVTDALLDGAVSYLRNLGYGDDNIHTERVPGTIELTFAAAQMARSQRYDAVIMLGCVIRGETPHFDYVCQNVTMGCALLNAMGNVPIIFGIVTTENLEQALARAGGKVGNKGSEAAETALKMVFFAHDYK